MVAKVSSRCASKLGGDSAGIMEVRVPPYLGASSADAGAATAQMPTAATQNHNAWRMVSSCSNRFLLPISCRDRRPEARKCPVLFGKISRSRQLHCSAWPSPNAGIRFDYSFQMCRLAPPASFEAGHQRRPFPLLDGASRNSGNKAIEEEVVGDCNRHARDQGTGHQFAPVVDVAAHQVCRDAERYRLLCRRGNECQRVDELLQAERECEDHDR